MTERNDILTDLAYRYETIAAEIRAHVEGSNTDRLLIITLAYAEDTTASLRKIAGES